MREQIGGRPSRTLKFHPLVPRLREAPVVATKGARMNLVSSIAQSGLAAATASLGSSAHNIANLGTAGFKRELASHRTQAGGGVATDFKQASLPGPAIEEDMVGMLEAKHAFQANLAVFKTADEMTGALLDIVA